MDSNWEAIDGYAIAKYPFLAVGENQVPMLTGDQFQVFHKCGKWFHGKNLISGLDGIFPCDFVAFYEGKFPKELLLGKQEDLLSLEASYVLNLAFEEINSNSGKCDPDVIVKYSLIIYEIMADFQFLKENQNFPQKFPKKHAHIAKKLDMLYDFIKKPKPQRSPANSLITMTTWGREMFTQGMETNRSNTPPEYVLLQIKVEISDLPKPMNSRFELVGGGQLNIISAPISFTVIPNAEGKAEVKLLFDELDLAVCKEQIYLVIYSYEITPGKGIYDRDCRACAVVELPTCRRRSIFTTSQEKPKEAEATAKSTIENKIQNLHTNIIQDGFMTEGQYKMKYKIKWTAYQGTYQNLIDNKNKDQKLESQASNLIDYTHVYPLLLPQTMIPSEQRSFIYFTFKGFELDSKKKRTRAIVRLVDTHIHPHKFIDTVENIDTRAFDQREWISPTLRNNKSFTSSETFAIDISNIDTPLDQLFMVVEFQRSNISDSSLIPYGYTFVPLTAPLNDPKNNGKTKKAEITKYSPCIPPNFFAQTRDIYPFDPKDPINRKADDFIINPAPTTKKALGNFSCQITISSTKHTNNQDLYNLITYESSENQDMSHIGQAIENWNKIPMNEWSKFIKILLRNFCLIISSTPSLAESAFQCLKDIFIKVLITPTYLPHIKLLEEFVRVDFSEILQDEKYSEILGSFYQTVLSSIKNDFEKLDISSQEYRSLVKVAPYLLELVSRSFKVSQDMGITRGLSVDRCNSDLKMIFNKLTDIVSIVQNNDEKDLQKKSTVFAVQKLILDYLAQIIQAVHISFNPEIICKFLSDFIPKVRKVAGDKKQTLIDKAKIRLILSLSSTPVWTEQSERETLKDLLADELKQAANQPQLNYLFCVALASLFFSVRNEFILDFFDPLKRIYDAYQISGDSNRDTKQIQALSRLLLNVIFNFPKEFLGDKTEVLIKIMKSELIGSQERLFTFAHYLHENEEDLISEMEDPEFSFKKELVMTYLNTAIEAKSQQTIGILDNKIYPSSSDFVVIRKLVTSLPEEDIQLFADIPDPVIKCYAMYSKPNTQITDLEEIFNFLIPHGFEVSAMRATYQLRNQNGFEYVPHLFSGNKKLKKLATCVSNITNMKIEEIYQDPLADAYSTLISYCEENNLNDILAELLSYLVDLQFQYKNSIEQSFAILKLCQFYASSEKPPTPEQQINLDKLPFLKPRRKQNQFQYYTIEKAKCRKMREILIALYTYAINLLIEGNFTYPAYALPIIDELKNKCIYPQNITRPIAEILQIQSKVYEQAANNDQVYFFFYRVLFKGNGFDESLRDKAMMYRTSGFMKADQFMRNLSKMFPESQCFQSEEEFDKACQTIDPEKGQLILLTNAEPANVAEVDDPFYMAQLDTKPKFVTMYENNRGLKVFKTQISKNLKKFEGMINEFQISQILQTYYFIEGEFPTYARRKEVIAEKTFQRILKPIQTACYMMTKQYEELTTLTNTFHYFHIHNTNVDGGQINAFRMKIKGTVEASVNGGVSNYISAFLTDKYIQENPDDKVYVDKLREILAMLMDEVAVALDTIQPFCRDDNQRAQQESNKESFASLLVEMENAGVKTHVNLS